MTIGDRVYLRRSMGYGGEMHSKGSVIELKGLRNDEALLTQNKVIPVPKDAQLVQCSECGTWFISDNVRTIHGNKVHTD